jgi:FtsP/CotA-like multicopper oxidase with cupredoxin domain
MRCARFCGRRSMVSLILFLIVASAKSAGNPTPLPLPLVVPNDNRTPAGQLHNGVLNLRLELRDARWYPEKDGGCYREVYAFAEEGAAPQSSGPLIRVLQGTQVHATIRNILAVPAKVYGLHQHPGDPNQPLPLEPGQTRELQFVAGEPGTYLYWATTSDKPLDQRGPQEALLSGAFIVDAPGTTPADRVFVIAIWQTGTPGSPGHAELPSINGKSFPYTERVTYRQGETIHWRVLNASWSDHAMHLHGFFFELQGEGDGEHYNTYAPELRPLGVTQHIDPGHAFEIAWTPDRAGNWLFHCHMVVHMSGENAPKDSEAASPMESPDHEQHGTMTGMSGLVLGVTVTPNSAVAPRPAAAPSVAPHKVQLVISDNPNKVPLYDVAVNDPRFPQSATSNTPSLVGPPIVLTRGEPAEIEVKNMTSGPTTIHWHGMELESYYDGVAGWTGSGTQLSPPVPAGTSFLARMTPPRSGTFVYHTHWHDLTQILNGVYGPLIVLEPGQKYDPEHDRTIVFGEGKYAPFGYLLLINGHPQPDPVSLQVGATYHLRLINITDNSSDLWVRLSDSKGTVQWKVVGKDGAAMPPAQLKMSGADMGITVGEVYDVEYRADTPGLANLDVWETSYPSRASLPLSFAPEK